MSELFLILHKVRGEPAFDIAQKCCVDSPPCQPNCGCWDGTKCLMEGEWIIPTSGHTAHPYQTWKLGDVVHSGLGWVKAWAEQVPEDWPDHYHCNNPDTKAKAKEVAGGLLSLLGLGPKQDFKKRRFTSGN